MVRVPAPLVDDLLRLVGETIILTGRIHERLDVTARETLSLRKQYMLVQQLGQEMEELIDLQDSSLPQQRVVNSEAFDALEFDQYNELHTCSRRLVEAATDTRDVGQNIEDHLNALKDMLSDQGRLNRESQEAVLKTGMVPVQTIVPHLQRSVGQASRLTGKAVELRCIGADTLIDGDVLGGLLDPLMHVLRNAVDHGIEPQAARLESGKDATGEIQLEFQREGNHIVIRCEDDGAGLDLEAIREAAEARDLVGDNERLSDEELIHLTLKTNFSTRSEATQLSGRGIGLDAVNTQIVSLGGSLRLQSDPGRGCRIVMHLPLTLV
jgi:chemosensory pili system protein ChpA (sensor histidine kinase/response regulator)